MENINVGEPAATVVVEVLDSKGLFPVPYLLRGDTEGVPFVLLPFVAGLTALAYYGSASMKEIYGRNLVMWDRSLPRSNVKTPYIYGVLLAIIGVAGSTHI